MDESIGDLKAELKICYASKKARAISDIFTAFFKYGSLTAAAFFAKDIGIAWAGEHTYADVDIKLLANTNISISIAWGLSALGLLYGFYQNKLRKDTVEYLQTRIQGLEGLLDKNRTTSGLTIRGDTAPEERDDE